MTMRYVCGMVLTNTTQHLPWQSKESVGKALDTKSRNYYYRYLFNNECFGLQMENVNDSTERSVLIGFVLGTEQPPNSLGLQAWATVPAGVFLF